MAVGLTPPAELPAVAGVRLGTAALGGRPVARDDLCVIELRAGARASAVFTNNAFCAAPVTIARRHLARNAPRYLLINAGNANAGTGPRGLHDAVSFCAALATEVGCEPGAVLPFSTGVIGQPLSSDGLKPVLARAVQALNADGWLASARAIMTTDTVPKGATRRFTHGGIEHRVTGIAKGAGMICPDMATMLAFIATDAAVGQQALDECLRFAVAGSFNRITVDGDTSTNDACLLMASGASSAPAIENVAANGYASLRNAVAEVCTELAQAIIRDAEGATKFVTVRVDEGLSEVECLQVAYTIAHSPLVKTALYASDANWGRILAAVGRADLEALDVDKVCIYLGDVCIVENGGVANGYREEDGAGVMAKPEITLRVSLGRGDSSAAIWTSDLSHEYVTINAEYRT